MDPNKSKQLISKQQIAQKVKEAALQLKRDYAGKDLVIVMVLKGAICLVSDLIRELTLPFELEYVQCTSYGARGVQRGDLQIIGLDRLQIQGRDVLVVDDIFDSGQTLTALIAALKQKGPSSVKTLVLLSKKVPRSTPYNPNYVLFEIDDLFVVGYGLDYKERNRGLPGICVLEYP